jgi:hypothetical protein
MPLTRTAEPTATEWRSGVPAPFNAGGPARFGRPAHYAHAGSKAAVIGVRNQREVVAMNTHAGYVRPRAVAMETGRTKVLGETGTRKGFR